MIVVVVVVVVVSGDGDERTGDWWRFAALFVAVAVAVKDYVNAHVAIRASQAFMFSEVQDSAESAQRSQA